MRSPASALGALATKLGFGTVANYTQFAELPKKPADLFPRPRADARWGQAAHHQWTAQFRPRFPSLCADRLFVTGGPRHQTVPLVQMGFDEVLFITDPFSDMSHKLSDQLQHELVYVESDHYFGPDRRRIERGRSQRSAPQARRLTPISRIRVVRDPRMGISTMDVAH
jgi:hypothetical protein